MTIWLHVRQTSDEYARLRQMAERELRRRIDDAVEVAIEQYLEDPDDYMDPFSRLRLKRHLLKGMGEHIERHAAEVAAKTLRRAYG